MKYFFLAVTVFLFPDYSFGQYRYFYLPNDYNSFINSKDICWAATDNEVYHFNDSKKIAGTNIYDYLLKKMISRKITAYRSAEVPSRGEGYPYENSYLLTGKGEKIEVSPKLYADSLKSIRFQVIFYVENYCLKSHLISASPQYLLFSESGVNLGYTGSFITALNKNYRVINGKSDKIVFVKSMQSELNFEIPMNAAVLKETYGMNLLLSLWYGAATGKTQVVDLKTNIVIKPDEVMKYTIFDSLYANDYDSTGEITRTFKIPGVPVSSYMTNSAQFIQDIYYNITKNYFYTVIKDVLLWVKYNDFHTHKPIEEKRFKILFH